MADIKKHIKVKLERITNLKKALRILNLENDKRNIDHVAESDLDEYDDLLDDDYVPRNVDHVSETLSTSNVDVDNDCIEVGNSNPTPQSKAITIGVDAGDLQLDKDFSQEYSYTIDVR